MPKLKLTLDAYMDFLQVKHGGLAKTSFFTQKVEAKQTMIIRNIFRN